MPTASNWLYDIVIIYKAQRALRYFSTSIKIMLQPPICERAGRSAALDAKSLHKANDWPEGLFRDDAAIAAYISAVAVSAIIITLGACISYRGRYADWD